MKTFRIIWALTAAGLVAGCAAVGSHTKTDRYYWQGTNLVHEIERTDMQAWSAIDSNQAMQKFSNRSRPASWGTNANAFAPGTYIGNVNESATSSGLTNLIQALKILAPLMGAP